MDLTLVGRKIVIIPREIFCNTAAVGGYDLLRVLIVMSPLTRMTNVENVQKSENETKVIHQRRVARGKLYISGSLPDTVTILRSTTVASLTV